MNLFKS